MEFLSGLPWAEILGSIGALAAAALVPWIRRASKALNLLAEAVAGTSANGAGITSEEKETILKALKGK